MPLPSPKCEKCNTEMLLREKGFDKFWGCPKYRQCGGKTKPYAGVDKPKPTENEILARMELKLDWIIENLQHPSVPKVTKPVIPKEGDQEMTSLKEILESKGETPKDELTTGEIPF